MGAAGEPGREPFGRLRRRIRARKADRARSRDRGLSASAHRQALSCLSIVSPHNPVLLRQGGLQVRVSSVLAIEAKGLFKAFDGKPAVRGIDIAVPEGSIYGILGPNGAGKTTTLRMLLGIIEPDSGHRSLLGHERPLEAARVVGYLPEERGLYPAMTTREAIAFMGALRGLPLDDRAQARRDPAPREWPRRLCRQADQEPVQGHGADRSSCSARSSTSRSWSCSTSPSPASTPSTRAGSSI